MTDIEKNALGSERVTMLWLGAILAAAALVYARSLNYGLVNWDDGLARLDMYGGGLGARELWSILTPRLSTTYQPVRELTTAVTASLYPRWGWIPYHVVSVLLYLGSAAFLFFVLKKTLSRAESGLDSGGQALAALAGTAFFALHPGHAEVVAWTLGQKDALVGFFYIAAVYFHVRPEKPALRDMLATLACFLLALGSKPSAVSLPLVLAAHDFIFRPSSFRRPALKLNLALYGVLVLPALAAVAWFVGTTARTGAVLLEGGLMDRLGRTAAAVNFSALKMVLPVNLTMRYPAFSFGGATDPWLWLQFCLAAVLVVFTVRGTLRGRVWAFFCFWALLALLPNSNLVPIRIERADRYYYLSSMGFAGCAGWAVARLHALAGERRHVVTAALALAFAALALASFRQVGYWKDAPTAWGRVVSLYPDMSLGSVSLGESWLAAGQEDLALETWQPLLLHRPPNRLALNGTVRIFLRRGQTERAVEFLQLGLHHYPGDDGLSEMLALTYARFGNRRKALETVEAWKQSNPDSRRADIVLAGLHGAQGETQAAVEAMFSHLERNPRDIDAMTELAAILIGRGDHARAESLIDRADGINPARDRNRLVRAYLYSRTGRRREAFEIYSGFPVGKLDVRGLEYMGAWFFGAEDYERALGYFSEVTERHPTLATGHNNRAVTLESMGRLEEAEAGYARAVELDSSYADAWYNRGNALDALGRPGAARESYARADSLVGGRDPAIIEALLRVSRTLGDSLGAIGVERRLKGVSAAGDN